MQASDRPIRCRSTGHAQSVEQLVSFAICSYAFAKYATSQQYTWLLQCCAVALELSQSAASMQTMSQASMLNSPHGCVHQVYGHKQWCVTGMHFSP